MHTFQKQNQLQDKQIKHLAKFLKTMHQVSRHSEMLYEMDTKMFIINKIPQDVMWSVNALQYESDVIHYFKLESIECIPHSMPLEGTQNHYINT